MWFFKQFLLLLHLLFVAIIQARVLVPRHVDRTPFIQSNLGRPQSRSRTHAALRTDRVALRGDSSDDDDDDGPARVDIPSSSVHLLTPHLVDTFYPFLNHTLFLRMLPLHDDTFHQQQLHTILSRSVPFCSGVLISNHGHFLTSVYCSKMYGYHHHYSQQEVIALTSVDGKLYQRVSEECFTSSTHRLYAVSDLGCVDIQGQGLDENELCLWKIKVLSLPFRIIRQQRQDIPLSFYFNLMQSLFLPSASSHHRVAPEQQETPSNRREGMLLSTGWDSEGRLKVHRPRLISTRQCQEWIQTLPNQFPSHFSMHRRLNPATMLCAQVQDAVFLNSFASPLFLVRDQEEGDMSIRHLSLPSEHSSVTLLGVMIWTIKQHQIAVYRLTPNPLNE